MLVSGESTGGYFAVILGNGIPDNIGDLGLLLRVLGNEVSK